jgi:hypothetical protein
VSADETIAEVESQPIVMPLGLKLIVPQGEICTDDSC